MTSLSDALNVSYSGLKSVQSALEVTSKNVSNVNTPGYSRKIANFENRVLDGSSIGTHITTISRSVNKYLLHEARVRGAEAKEISVQNQYYDNLQNLFGSPQNNSSVAHTLSSLIRASESLAISPDKSVEQHEFVFQAKRLTQQLNTLSDQVQEYRTQTDQAIGENTERINDLLKELETIAGESYRAETGPSKDGTDYADRKDAILTELSDYMDIVIIPRGDINTAVFLSDGTPLYDQVATKLTHNNATNLQPPHQYSKGSIDGIKTESGHDITKAINSGEMRGLITMRDEVLVNLQADIDQLAHQLQTTINKIHNRGSSVFAGNNLTSTKRFFDVDKQTISLGATNDSQADVALVLVNNDGEQVTATTLRKIMTSNQYGKGVQSKTGPWNVRSVFDTVKDWLQSRDELTNSSVGIDAQTGIVNINLNNDNVHLVMRDQESSSGTSAAKDITIRFDSDGDGDTDATHEGFSSFFGLNDFFISDNRASSYESASTLSSRRTLQGTLTFYDEAQGLNKALGTVEIPANSSLATVVDTINAAGMDVNAHLINDNDRVRLQISSTKRSHMLITQESGQTFLEDLGIAPYTTGRAKGISVREDIGRAPALVSTGLVSFAKNSQQYTIAKGDNTIVNQMVAGLSEKTNLPATGNFSNSSRSLSEYAADIIALNSNNAKNNQELSDEKSRLADTLKLEAKNVSGVNLDQEMADLIILQRSYAASGKAISTIRTLFDILNGIV